MKKRIFFLMQYGNNPLTGEDLHFNESVIREALKKHKIIKRWAWVCHDKDVLNQQEVDERNQRIDKLIRESVSKAKIPKELIEKTVKQQWENAKTKGIVLASGDKKPVHWHVVIELTQAYELRLVAKWFNVPQNFIEVPKGKGAFLDCLAYLTHEELSQQAEGKFRYPDEEIHANFDFRKLLKAREESGAKSEEEQLLYDVMYSGKTLLDAQEENRIFFMNNLDKFKKLRFDYIAKRAPMPNFRLNYYIDGKGGIGKNSASKALARALYPDLAPEECYFEVGGSKVSFDGYDGQPVIIWNDKRSGSFIREFGREETFDLFDSHPTRARHNIKYSSICLTNEVNIINGVEPYLEFLNGLSGEYFDPRTGLSMGSEDKGQAFRRFPIILCLRESDFDVLLNKGVAYGTQEFEWYETDKRIVGNFGKVARELSGRAKETVTVKLTEPILETTEKVKQIEDMKINNEKEIPSDFENFGESIPEEKPETTKINGETAEIVDGDLPF